MGVPVKINQDRMRQLFSIRIVLYFIVNKSEKNRLLERYGLKSLNIYFIKHFGKIGFEKLLNSVDEYLKNKLINSRK